MIKHIKDFLKSTASFENMRTTAIMLFITYIMTGSVIKTIISFGVIVMLLIIIYAMMLNKKNIDKDV